MVRKRTRLWLCGFAAESKWLASRAKLSSSKAPRACCCAGTDRKQIHERTLAPKGVSPGDRPNRRARKKLLPEQNHYPGNQRQDAENDAGNDEAGDRH